MALDLTYQRNYHGRIKRTVKCVICHSIFTTFYKHKKTCSDVCKKKLLDYHSNKNKVARVRRIFENNPEYKEKVYKLHREYYAKSLKNNPETIQKRKEYRLNNIDKINNLYNNWFKNNKDKKYQQNHEYREKRRSGFETKNSHEEFQKRLKLFSECIFCGNREKLTIEHLMPLSKGGTNALENIFISCKSCNSSKNNKDWILWYRQQNFYNKNKEIKIANLHKKVS